MREGSNNLSYPCDKRPEAAELVEVAAGVFWIRMPLPISLNHINLWLLEEEDGWTIVDTGMATEDIKSLWNEIFESQLNSKPVKRVIVTHMHLDHVGLAGWLCEKHGVELWMSRTEYLTCRVVAAEIGGNAPKEAIEFFRTAGFSDDALSVFQSRFRGRSAFVTPIPGAFQRLTDGQCIRIDDTTWNVRVGQGHSPEHACLYSENLNVLIAGDQILPRISPNVGVRPNEPHANPLKDWLESCQKFRDTLPADVLVLPSHGDPFFGVHSRLEAMMQDHHDGLTRLYDFCNVGRMATEVFPILFKGPINDKNLVIAAGEAIAHLNYLLAEGKLAVETDEQGVKRYRQCK